MSENDTYTLFSSCGNCGEIAPVQIPKGLKHYGVIYDCLNCGYTSGIYVRYSKADVTMMDAIARPREQDKEEGFLQDADSEM